MAKCIFCDKTIESSSTNGIYFCTCQNCGKYKTSLEAFFDLPGTFERREYKNKKHLFSGYIREMDELKLSLELITNTNFQSILSSPLIPKTMMEKLEKLLLYIYRKTEQLHQEIEIDESMPAIAYAKNSEELSSMLVALQELKLLELKSKNPARCVLTLDGIQRAESLQKDVVNSKQCFVAMWFDGNMMDIYNKYIAKAAEDAGYQPLNISQKEYNDKICDQIIAEIRKSKFLIADYTGNRGGVYFEAGFALGLGLPVIWTCRKDELEKLHFDVNHYNFIVWETGEELYEKLKYRIQATIL